MSAVRRIERVLADLGQPYSDLDEAFDADRLASVSASIKALRSDALAGGQAYRALLPDSEKPAGRLSNFGAWLGQYRQFRAGEAPGDRPADLIRQYALDAYIIPAREEELVSVAIPVRAVHDALGLTQAWANVCQALTGSKFLDLAEVDPPRTEGPPVSSTTIFHYDVEPIPFTQEAVEAALARLGDVIKDDAVKMFAVRLPEGREIGVQRDRPPAQIWVEGHVAAPLADKVELYAPDRGRHSGLTPRLSHRPPNARTVTMVKVSGWAAFQQLVDQYVQGGRSTPDSAPQEHASSMPVVSPTNLILYGPPGTGKTFATAREAVKLCSPGVNLDDRTAVEIEYRRLVEARQVEFVTFHQSYSYEDFVEGLRPPVSSKDGEGDEDKSGFRLEVSPGVFHRIATRAAASKGSTGKSFDLTGRQVFKMSIGEAANPEDAYLFEESLKNGYALLGFGEIDWSDERFAKRDAMIEAWKEEQPDAEPPTPRSASVQCPDMFRNWIKPGDIMIVSKGNGSFRAIGEVTGPYEYAPREDGGYFHRRAVNWLWSDRTGVPVEEIYAKRFSMRTLYMLTPSDLNMVALERYITSQEPGGPSEPFVLIIDEINRANISKVFGELITLLEPDKRTTPEGGGLTVRLPYSKQPFGVPANLHVIGTMNTADRSIALLDTALRRRFEFRELMPDPDLPELKTAGARCGVDLSKLLRTLNDRIEYLFDREHQIGHAYFIKCASRDDVDAVMRHKVIPLLAEYFYEDWSKVALVLGDADADTSGKFLDRTELKPPTGLSFEGGDARWRWTVRPEFASDAYADFQ
ncbi:MAG: AAA family ATPase [Proteobacteria bacterium]|nr:AAA family ATPase [Pseudomonadota bacterium]